MGINKYGFRNVIEGVLDKFSIKELEEKLKSNEKYEFKELDFGFDKKSINKRIDALKLTEEQKKILSTDLVNFSDEIEKTDGTEKNGINDYRLSIENYIGLAKMPIGVAGPLLINGSNAQGVFYVPMATTEAAMLASYTRGSVAITESGGCRAFVINEGVSRCPCFLFENLIEVGKFLYWLSNNEEELRKVAESTSRYAKVKDTNITIEGNRVYMNIIYTTGDASGQNMVTIATEKLCEYIEKNSDIKPYKWYIEANMSGDKKASSQSFQNVRGKKVVCEIVIPKEILEKRLSTTADDMQKFYQVSQNGGIQSGVFGIQGHYANALAGIYIACGQDAACVSESSVGITRFEADKKGNLYASVTLPNIIVGTVGGGTSLPTQRACLEMMGLYGPGNANKFAEVVASMCLAGELSISAAICSNNFSRAHKIFSRLKNKKEK